MGLGPTCAAKKPLEDDQIAVHTETLCLWLKEDGLWSRKRKCKLYRAYRERRACFDELLQIDGYGYEHLLKPGGFIAIKRYLDGSMRFWYEDVELSYERLSRKPELPSKSRRYDQAKGPADRLLLSKNSRKNKAKIPWGQFNPNWLKSA